ncbi:peptidase C39 [Chitinophaga caeni]|uniref:Peptidase C39 n=1 Tax=Chitinophaga caeni TaxID=2029983 RepID=A0A291R181_9BACT|nr:peptidase domain-containing ABC transporter [Chitinophaga caeni]ATL49911.1 peptidase C39 [Chitinophaga caeni]
MWLNNRIKRKSKVKQRDLSDCGAACLSSIAAHYNLHIPVARIRQYAYTDHKGTNVLGLIEAAQKLGFEAKGVKGPFESLAKIPKPSIAHVVLKGVLHHYVVIYKVTKERITIMDPADGKVHEFKSEDFKKIWTGVLILILPGENFKQEKLTSSHFQRFWYLLAPHKSILLQALFGSIVYTILGLSTSIYVQKIVDNVLVDGNKNLLNLLGSIMIVILLFQLFIGNTKSIFALKTGQQIDAQLILGYYKHLLKLPQQFFDTMRVGEITSRINDAVKIRSFINDTAVGLVVNVFIVIFSFAVMFAYYWKLALIVLAIIPVYIVVYQLSNAFNKKLQRKLMEDNAELGGQLVESLNAASTIKRFGLEEYANIKTENRFVKLLRTIFKSATTNLYIGSAASFVTSAFVVVILWIGSYFVIDRQLTPGELLSFYALLGYFTGPAMSLIGANKSMQDALIASDRLFEILDLEQESNEQKMDLTPEMLGDISFHNVSFKYNTRAEVFKDFNLHIRKGEITAIVGESGSGKSTLMNLLQNLYPLQAGQICIGNIDIKYIHNDSLRKKISVVPQHIDLFAGTVLENIAVGDFEADMQQVIKIAQVLGIMEFIEKLPNGFLTLLGEHGVNLSGGQRQRLAIARAMYRNPDILIFDEATSSLDPVSDQFVQLAVQQLKHAGKTIIIIAHRLSTVMNADKIVVLHEGSMAEEGTHQQLLQKNSVYSKLWEHHKGVII